MDLLNMLTSQLGVNQEQAAGGAGMIFDLAKEKLGGDFSQISSAIPEVEGLIDKAPDTGGGLMGALGGLASSLGADSLGNLASLASGFSKLDLDADMISKFVPVILDYVKGKAGDGVMGLLGNVLK